MNTPVCKGCPWLRGVTKIGAGYCSKRDTMVFETDPACKNRENRLSNEVWVSYGESGKPDDDAVAIYWNKPTFNENNGKYFDQYGLHGCETEFNLLGPDVAPRNAFRCLLPGIDKIKGTKKLLRVTVDIVDQWNSLVYSLLVLRYVMKRLEVIYAELQSIALKHGDEQQEMEDALSIARWIENRYQTDDVWKLKAQILIEPFRKYWPQEISRFLEFNRVFRDLPEEYEKRAELARAEYRVDHLKHYIVTGREIDWKQLKSDSKLIKEAYDKK